jgi:hypothetical protein
MELFMTTTLERERPTKTRKTPAVNVAGDPVSALQREDQLYAEEANGRQLTDGEIDFLEAMAPRAGFTPDEQRRALARHLERQRSRHQRIAQNRQRAGKTADRAAAVQRLASAKENRESTLPGLLEQIAKLQRDADELDRAVNDAESAVTARHQAVEVLTDERSLPEFVLRRTRRPRPEWQQELVTLRSRLQAIETISSLRPDRDAEAIRLHVEGNASLGGDTVSRCQRFFEQRDSSGDAAAIGRMERGESRFTKEFWARRVRVSAWNKYVESLGVEAEQARQRIAELEPLEREAAAEIERLKSFYVPK